MTSARPLLIALLLAITAAWWPGSAGAQTLYWLDTNYAAPTLNRSNLDGAGITSVALTAGSLPEGLAADNIGRIYWTEAAWSNASVQHGLHDLSHRVAIVPGGSVLRGIAVDQIAERLYWTSSNLVAGSKVLRSPLTGAGAVTLIALGPAANPRGIAVNNALNRIYWADFDQNAIYTATLDGAAPAILVSLPVGSSPYGVTVDPSTNRVYWTEYGTGLLKRSEPGGTSVTTILSGLVNPTYLTVDVPSSRLFWTEGGVGAQRIRRSTLTGSGLVTLPPPLTTYGGIGIGSGASVSTETTPPTELSFDRVWPTPGSGPVHVAFSLPRDAHVRLTILDLQGREVAVLEDGTVAAGRHERVWNGGLRTGPAAPGVYFARFTAEGLHMVRRLVLTR